MSPCVLWPPCVAGAHPPRSSPWPAGRPGAGPDHCRRSSERPHRRWPCAACPRGRPRPPPPGPAADPHRRDRRGPHARQRIPPRPRGPVRGNGGPAAPAGGRPLRCGPRRLRASGRRPRGRRGPGAGPEPEGGVGAGRPAAPCRAPRGAATPRMAPGPHRWRHRGRDPGGRLRSPSPPGRRRCARRPRRGLQRGAGPDLVRLARGGGAGPTRRCALRARQPVPHPRRPRGRPSADDVAPRPSVPDGRPSRSSTAGATIPGRACSRNVWSISSGGGRPSPTTASSAW